MTLDNSYCLWLGSLFMFINKNVFMSLHLVSLAVVQEKHSCTMTNQRRAPG
jgi:hypothetical protein